MSKRDKQRDRMSENTQDDDEPDFSDPEDFVDRVTDEGMSAFVGNAGASW